MKHLFPIIGLFFFSVCLQAQISFPEMCLGTWKGTMFIYSEGELKDSVASELIIDETEDPKVYTWKTVYHSPDKDIVKDYKFIIHDSIPNMYILDEGDGITLKEYRYGNKLFSVFEVQGNLLTSFYEFKDDELIFEIISGKTLDKTEGVTNYPVLFWQRAVYRRAD